MDRYGFHHVTKLFATRLSRRATLGAAAVAAVPALVGRGTAAPAKQATPGAGVEGTDPEWYAAVRRSRFAAGVPSEEVARIVRDSFIPLIAGVPGFVAYYVIDTGQGEHVTISIFSDPAGPAESSRRSADWVPQALEGLVEGPAAIVTEGEVQVYAAAELGPATPAIE